MAFEYVRDQRLKKTAQVTAEGFVQQGRSRGVASGTPNPNVFPKVLNLCYFLKKSDIIE